MDRQREKGVDEEPGSYFSHDPLVAKLCLPTRVQRGNDTSAMIAPVWWGRRESLPKDVPRHWSVVTAAGARHAGLARSVESRSLLARQTWASSIARSSEASG